MVPPKRKENPNSKTHAGNVPKKPKKEELRDLETATDSDPLVESDTTSQSGDHDGVSWPSDEELEAGEDLENDDGGVRIAAEAAGASQSAKKAPNTNGSASGKSEQGTRG